MCFSERVRVSTAEKAVDPGAGRGDGGVEPGGGRERRPDATSLWLGGRGGACGGGGAGGRMARR